ncbi:TetR/AcrR family transcriptional regulator [Desulforudis sp. 1088]|uniref:TetR/AcrR family transcriptional regulator n=1 Tax=unclassified Candidatus Desulforudis TaxID=2635950 RepID=UPI00348979E5
MRARIINGMEELARQKGFSAVTVDELAGHVGISKRTLYRYFRSKEEIIAAVIEGLTSRVGEAVEGLLATHENPIQKLKALVPIIGQNVGQLEPALRDLQRHYPRLWEKIEGFRAGRITYMTRLLEEGIAQGCFSVANPKLVVTALIASVRTILNPEFIFANGLSFQETVQNLLDLFFYGIVTREKENYGPERDPS